MLQPYFMRTQRLLALTCRPVLIPLPSAAARQAVASATAIDKSSFAAPCPPAALLTGALGASGTSPCGAIARACGVGSCCGTTAVVGTEDGTLIGTRIGLGRPGNIIGTNTTPGGSPGGIITPCRCGMLGLDAFCMAFWLSSSSCFGLRSLKVTLTISFPSSSSHTFRSSSISIVALSPTMCSFIQGMEMAGRRAAANDMLQEILCNFLRMS